MLLIYEPKHTALVTEMETMEAEVKALVTSNAKNLARSVNNTNVQGAATAQLSAASEKLNDLRIAVSESTTSYDEKKDLVKKLMKIIVRKGQISHLWFSRYRRRKPTLKILNKN